MANENTPRVVAEWPGPTPVDRYRLVLTCDRYSTTIEEMTIDCMGQRGWKAPIRAGFVDYAVTMMVHAMVDGCLDLKGGVK